MVVQVAAFFQNINLNTHSIENNSSKACEGFDQKSCKWNKKCFGPL